MDSFKRIPQELKALGNWVCFRYEKRGKNGKLSKIPYNPLTGKLAKANDPSTWTAFADAVRFVGRYNGIGFQFGNSPYVGIDIDHCVSGGRLSAVAADIVGALASYSEYSPSGTGVHIICRGRLLQEKGANRCNAIGLEIYQTGRYFTMTGNVLPGYEAIEERSEAIAGVQRKYILLPKEAKQPPAKVQPPASKQSETSTERAVSTGEEEAAGSIAAPTQRELSGVEAIVEAARRSKQGAAFGALYSGQWQGSYKSQSEADIALCNMLAFWTKKDAALMDELFRRSGLMRPKWDEVHGADTYGNLTIQEAVAKCKSIYDPTALAKQKAENHKANRKAMRDVLKDCNWPVTEVDCNKKIVPIKAAFENVQYLCSALGIQFRYNLLTKEIDVNRADLKPLTFDAIIAKLRGICHKNYLKVSKADLIDHIFLIAEQNQYSPVCEYLLECLANWDGKSRVEQLFNCFKLDDSVLQDADFLKVLFEKWLISCVKMAFNDGSEAAQGLLVLRGKQGIGKTRFLYTILPFPEWGADGITLDPSVKDDILKVMRFWLVELGEINDTLKKEKLDRLKSFVTSRTDNLRKPYKRAAETIPRRTVFIGTVNGEGFLKDATGERRYWVIAVTAVEVDPTFDVKQLWGEITYKALKLKLPHWLTKEEIEKLNAQNEAYKKLTSEEQVLLDMLDWDAPDMCWQWVTATELCERVCLPRTRNRLIAKALRRLADVGRTLGKQITCPTNHMDKRYKVPPVKTREFYEGTST